MIGARTEAVHKPPWLKVRIPSGAEYNRLKDNFRGLKLHTVCEEARCPNLAECWRAGTATIMILGDVCTRGCRFCAVKTAKNGAPVDPDEPRRVAEALARMELRYVVLTSVDRDDLDDGGAGVFADTIRETRQRCPELIIEALIPDFRGDVRALGKVVDAAPQVIGQNIETVQRLTRYARDRRCGYEQTLDVLTNVKALDRRVYTKSAILLGMGETRDEVLATMRDLRARGVDILTLGQYLQPTRKHLPVAEFVHPDRFRHYEEQGLALGFRYVAAGPMVRSSYKAAEFFVEKMLTAGH
ncbi:MAG: lipoyl synthase [Deltaproteobacteria bacterium]|nr:lipoyl synthase [Deltaproteobacteria bacterium]